MYQNYTTASGRNFRSYINLPSVGVCSSCERV